MDERLQPLRSIWLDMPTFRSLASIVATLCILAISANGSRYGASGYPHNASLLWGPYRPHLYMGVRARSPDSPLIGLMWAHEDGKEIELQDLRHSCEQSYPAVHYNWLFYDPRFGGSQIVRDPANGLHLGIDFIRAEDGESEGAWAFRVSGRLVQNKYANSKSRFIVYVGMNGLGDDIDASLKCTLLNNEVQCHGQHPSMAHFQLSVRRSQLHPLDADYQISLRNITVRERDLWKAEFNYLRLQGGSKTVNSASESGHLFFTDMIFSADFQFDVLFNPESNVRPFSSANLTSGMTPVSESFSARFQSVFGPQRPFIGEDFVTCSSEMLSNLLGGLGYFYGDSREDRSYAPEYEEKTPEFWKAGAAAQARNGPFVAPTNATELFSLVPSRAYFPRGFLWDEGFHLLVVLEWDVDLAMEILLSWFSRMDENGWIAREQILGEEARSCVPSEFQIQYPFHANPPTFFLVISAFCDMMQGNKDYHGHYSKYLQEKHTAIGVLEGIYLQMERIYQWFRQTQIGNATSIGWPAAVEGYRWRGRTPQYAFASGLDDYPRPEPPNPAEMHVDALSWVGFMAKSLAKLAQVLGKLSDRDAFLSDSAKFAQSMHQLHWCPSEKAFCDTSVDVNGEHSFVCHKGYVSLFPLMLGLVDEQDVRNENALDMLRDPNQLWTPFGIRSLSKQSEFYSTGDDYWRGPIWININFLILQWLLKLAITPGPYQRKAQEIYVKLRRNVVNTVYRSWRITGVAWEQYNAESGVGQRDRHFTGWTALVVKIMAMPNKDTMFPQSDRSVRLSTVTLWICLMLFLALAITFRKRIFRLRKRTAYLKSESSIMESNRRAQIDERRVKLS